MKFKLLSLKLFNWWIKITTTATIILLITILTHSAAANAVSNPPHTINVANAIYEEEQQLKPNIAFTVAP